MNTILLLCALLGAALLVVISVQLDKIIRLLCVVAESIDYVAAREATGKD